MAHPFIHSFIRPSHRVASRRAVPSSSSREVVASFSSSPRGDARRRDVVMTRATDGTDDDDVERGSTTRPTSATTREDDDDAETSARETREESGDDVRALDDAMAGFSLGTSGNARGTRGRGARRRRGGGGRADAARERDVDAGTMSPFEHGETYVLDDGGESDLDLGNYERFVDVSLTRDHNVTTGKVYQVREARRRGAGMTTGSRRGGGFFEFETRE